MLQADVVLGDFTTDNILMLSKGIYEETSTAYKEHQFVIVDEIGEESKVTENIEQYGNDAEKNDRTDLDRVEKNQVNKPSKNSKEKEQLNEKGLNSQIVPFAGNLNVDIDISPQKESVLSGNDAAYNLVLKLTGARTEYSNAKITVDLPIGDFTEFIQDVNELVIDGVVPTYNN